MIIFGSLITNGRISHGSRSVSEGNKSWAYEMDLENSSTFLIIDPLNFFCQWKNLNNKTLDPISHQGLMYPHVKICSRCLIYQDILYLPLQAMAKDPWVVFLLAYLLSNNFDVNVNNKCLYRWLIVISYSQWRCKTCFKIWSAKDLNDGFSEIPQA